MNPLLLALGVGALGVLAYKRYESVKVGDTVEVDSSAFGLPPPGLGTTATATAKVIAIGKMGDATMQNFLTPTTMKVEPGTPSIAVAPILGGTVAPAATAIPLGFVIKNLTPRLF